MATGSGKTKVMALAIAWQYFNAVAEARDDFAKTFLVIAPNVIVFERLRTDFAGGRIFRLDPGHPRRAAHLLGLPVLPARRGGAGQLARGAVPDQLQQLHDRPEPEDDEPDVMTAMLGPEAAGAGRWKSKTSSRASRPAAVPCMVLNDEAHHTHDEDSEWNKTHPPPARRRRPAAWRRNSTSPPRRGTPRGSCSRGRCTTIRSSRRSSTTSSSGRSRASPRASREQPSEIASIRYQAYLAAGVERWKEYRDQLAPLGRKPVLFVMMNDTAEADDVGDWLQKKYPAEFGGERLLIIHTNRSGDVVAKRPGQSADRGPRRGRRRKVPSTASSAWSCSARAGTCRA